MGCVRHRDDDGIDEILFVHPIPETVADAYRYAFLKLSLIERYKTSDFSGDEWRFSTGLFLRLDPEDEWELISTGSTLRGHCAQLFAELFGDSQEKKRPELFERVVGSICFQWKGRPVYSASHDGKATSLLVAAGHLSWSLILASEQGSHHELTASMCAQPGCTKAATNVYKLRNKYCYCGEPKSAGEGDVRAFCDAHARRGDCGLEDADRNYDVVQGRGPEINPPNPDSVSESTFGGFI